MSQAIVKAPGLGVFLNDTSAILTRLRVRRTTQVIWREISQVDVYMWPPALTGYFRGFSEETEARSPGANLERPATEVVFAEKVNSIFRNAVA